ncbi:MAG: SEC-C metal-binding domain-containing protein, partial [Gemmatimonadales bacterium]
GTERHESRRIDRQLRGRSGRQGDPGSSLFFLSLEDDLMRLFMADRVARYMDKTGAEEGEVITGKLVTRAIESAQKRVELQNFQQRKRLLEYDDVMNQQREVIYSLRLFALERGEELKAEARKMIAEAVEAAVTRAIDAGAEPETWDREGLATQLAMNYVLTVDAMSDPAATPTLPSLVEAAQTEAEAAFQRKVQYLKDFGSRIGIGDVDQQVLSQVMLSVIDEKWKDHLYDLDQLRNAIQYRAYGQKDPLVEYKKEAFEMFEDLIRDLRTTFTERYLKVQVNVDGPPPPPPPPRTSTGPRPAAPAPAGTDDLFAPPARERAAPTAAQAAASAPGAPPAVSTGLGRLGAAGGDVPEVGRNEPCPCGSGKKYKKCHGAAR